MRQLEGAGAGPAQRLVLERVPRLLPPLPAARGAHVGQPARPLLRARVGRLRRELLEPPLRLRLRREPDHPGRHADHQHAERHLPEKLPPPVAQRPTLLPERAQVRERPHRQRREHEHDREPGAVVHANRVRLPVLREPRPREGPHRHSEPGPAAEQQRRRALHARPPEHEPEHDRDAADEHPAARVGQQQPDHERVRVDDPERPQPVRVLPPGREPQRQRQRHREEQREGVPVSDRGAQPRNPPGVQPIAGTAFASSAQPSGSASATASTYAHARAVRGTNEPTATPTTANARYTRPRLK